MIIPQTEIIVRKDGSELLRKTVPPGEYVIGRGEDCAFQVIGEKVSRHHARLFVSYQDWSVADLGSANGTQLNEEPVGEAAVKVWPSQIIRVGDATVELRALTQSDPDATLMPTQETVRRHLPPELQSPRRYQIGKQIAQGGMGAILSAADLGIRREVAMKVMLNAMDSCDVLRFIEEAQVTGQLEHPNIVPVHELSVNEQGEVFYTMKMVRGITLKKVIELLTKGVGEVAKKYSLAALLTIFQKVCDAIAFAHSKGVIHRDLKPENIMLGDYGEVLVMDWGLARLVGSTQRATVVRTAKADEGDAMRTQTGSIMGTPTYMSPEQARGEIEKLDARSDIYALGTILFELLHLRPVVTGTEVMQIISKVQRGAVEWGTEKNQIPASLLAVCRKALALSIADRYPRVADLQSDLLAFQNGFATSAENASTWRQLTLFIRRNKAASIGVAAALIIGGTFGTKAIIEGRRAERALADLKRSAPSMFALGESEAAMQRFDSALEKIDTAIRLDPAIAPAYWQRAWVLLGQQKWSEAAAALRLAQQRDPAGTQRASILPVVERFATGQEKSDAQLLLRHLQSVNATGPLAALSRMLGMTPEARLAIVKAKVQQWLGKDAKVAINIYNGDLVVAFGNVAISDIEALRGLPIDRLNISLSGVSSLEPLRGMPLTWIDISRTRITDLSPLAGMPLTSVNLGFNKISDLSPLRGAPLRVFSAQSSPDISDASPLAGAPLEDVNISSPNLTNLDFLRDAPIQKLRIYDAAVTDLSILRGKPLKDLSIGSTAVRDLSPLADCPIETLGIASLRPDADLTPLLRMTKLQTVEITTANNRKGLAVLRAHPSLKTIFTSDKGLRQSVEEFWVAYDAKAK